MSEDFFGSEKSIAWQYPNLNDEIEGVIEELESVQLTHEVDGKQVEDTWSNGKPKLTPVMVLSGTGKDSSWDKNEEKWVKNDPDEDDGTRVVYCRGGIFTAIKDYQKEKKVVVSVGGKIKLKFAKKVAAQNKAHNPRKVFKVVSYTPPAPADPFDD